MKEARIFLGVSLFLFILSMIFVGINNANIREYENKYERTEAIITGVRTEHRTEQGTHKTRNVYYFVFTYTLGGQEYTAKDGASYYEVADGMLGSEVEIYVDPQAPQNALMVKNSDLYSLISVCIFLFFIATFCVGGLLLIHSVKRGFKHRLIFVWAPLFIICLSVVTSFICLPYAAVAEAFTHVRALIAYIVFGGAAVIACIIDGLIVLKRNRKKETIEY